MTLKREIGQLRALSDALKSLNAERSLGEVLQGIARAGRELLEARYAALAILDGDGTVRDFHVEGMSSEQIAAIGAKPCGRGLLGSVLRGSGATRVRDISADPRSSGFPPNHPRMRSFLGVPVPLHSQPIGNLYFTDKLTGREFSEEDEVIATILAEHAALAIENARLYGDLKEHVREVERSQAQVVQSAKLAAIGQLAANVAHEINNPLTAVLMRIGLFLESDSDQGRLEKLRVMEQEVIRARTIVRSLLDFARETRIRTVDADLNQVVKSTIPLVAHRAEIKEIQVREEYQERLPRVSVDMNQLKQVLVNLINNAFDAMGPGGSMRIATRASDGWVSVDVTDSGHGIEDHVLPHIFEPFFTTKPDVRGTGLGLSVSHGIITKHGGAIDVRTRVGEGTTFTVRLPQISPRLSEVTESV